MGADHDFRPIAIAGHFSHHRSVPPSQSHLFEKRTNWAMVILLVTVGIGTVLSDKFKPLPAHGPALFSGILLIFLATWYERDFTARFPRAGMLVFHLVLWGAFVFMAAIGVPGNFLWLLAMPPLSHAVGWLRWYVAAAVAVIYFLTTYWLFNGFQFGWDRLVSMSLSLGVAYVFTAVCTVAMMQALRAQSVSASLAEELEEANAQLRASSAQRAVLAASEERNRIARDIHDGLGHYLTVIAVQLQAAQALVETDAPRAKESLDAAENLTRKALEEVRRSVGTLRADRPMAPLHESIAALIAESGVHAKLQVEGVPRPLVDDVQQTLFRSVQEGLTNVRKHARAAHVEVKLSYVSGATVSVEITDDGCGDTRSAKTTSGFGLTGVRERVVGLGGQVFAGQRPDGGFCLKVEVPA